MEDYVIRRYMEYFRSSGIEPENVVCVPEQDVATFMVSINLGGNIVPCSEKNTWNPELYSFVELEEPLVLESAWLYSSDNPNPALARLAAKPFGFHCRSTKWCGCGNTAMPSSATGSGITVFSRSNNPPPKSLENQGFSGEAAF